MIQVSLSRYIVTLKNAARELLYRRVPMQAARLVFPGKEYCTAMCAGQTSCSAVGIERHSTGLYDPVRLKPLRCQIPLTAPTTLVPFVSRAKPLRPQHHSVMLLRSHILNIKEEPQSSPCHSLTRLGYRRLKNYTSGSLEEFLAMTTRHRSSGASCAIYFSLT